MGPTWNTLYSDELGHLCQGVGKGPTSTVHRVKVTNNFRVIHFHNIPRDCRKRITVTKVVCKFRPPQKDPKRTRITIMGVHIIYNGNVGTKIASLDI